MVWNRAEELARSRDRWNELAAQTPGGGVFLRQEWFDAAWQWAKSDSDLHVIALTDGDRLVGIAPLVLYRSGTFATRRHLAFLTVPDTQQCDVLAAAADRPNVIRHLARELHRRRRHWDILDLRYLSPASAAELAGSLRPLGLAAEIRDQSTNPAISLSGTWESYYARRSRRLKKGNNLIANRLAKGGHAVELQQVTAPSDSAALDDLVRTLAAISGRSWKRETGNSLNYAGPNAFIRRLTAHAASAGWLSVWLLRVDGEPVAMEYQLRYGGRIHALRADFDGALGELSPGTYLNWKMLEQLFETGAERYLMGPGENAYKLRWAEEHEPVQRVIAYSTTPVGRWRRLVDTRLRPGARSVRERLFRPEGKESS